MSQFLLGLDAGSSVTKAALFDRQGVEIASAAHRVPMQRPLPGWCEVDPDAAWLAARSAVAAVLQRAGVAGADIAAIGISAAMVGAWLVDRQGNPVRAGINWEDSRAQAMLDQKAADDPDFYSRVFRANGCVLQQGCTLPLVAWLREHEPHALARASHILSYKDFLRFRLTGEVAADRTEAAVAPGSARDRGRSGEMMALFGLTELAAKFPAALDSETVAGRITARAAQQTGLREGTPVAIGAGDVPSTVLGAGALEQGMMLAVFGTTCIVGVVSDEPVFTPANLGLLFTLPGEAWFRSMVNVAGTLNLDWAISAIMGVTEPDSALFEQLEAMVSAVPIGSGGVVFLPYLSESGIIAPVVDARARAGFHGLSARHGRSHLMRAVYEGVVLAMRDLVPLLPGATSDLLLTGGGARSCMWCQMTANALDRTVHVPEGSEFGARGAALLAATAIGWFPSIRAASLTTRRIQRTHSPDLGKRDAWDAAYQAYCKHRDQALGRR